MTDAEILQELKANHGISEDFRLSRGKNDPFDAYNDKAILEFKYRSSNWDEFYIEIHKIAVNYHIAEKTGRQFHFVIMTKDNVYTWNITEKVNKKEISSFEIIALPYNQQDGKNIKVNKLVTKLKTSESFRRKRVKN